MNFSTQWFKNSWLKSLGLKNSWLKSLGLKGPGLKLGVEKSGVEMSFNQYKSSKFLGFYSFIFSIFSVELTQIQMTPAILNAPKNIFLLWVIGDQPPFPEPRTFTWPLVSTNLKSRPFGFFPAFQRTYLLSQSAPTIPVLKTWVGLWP